MIVRKIFNYFSLFLDFVKNKENNMNFGFKTLIRVREHNTKTGEFTVKYLKNNTCLPGRTKLLEDTFSIPVNIKQHLFINDNVLASYDPETGADLNPITAHNSPSNILPRSNPEMFRRRDTRYWCAGDGAINKSIPNESHPSRSTDTRLYHMIPFRFIKSDESLSDAERKLYKLEVIFPESSPYFGYKGYYFKEIGFEKDETGIEMKVDGVDYLPKWSDTTPDPDVDTLALDNAFKGGKVQQNYVNLSLNILKEEFKEWFMFVDGGLGNASISEIGFITGLECVNGQGIKEPVYTLNKESPDYETKKMNSEIYDAELFAHLTMDPLKVSSDNISIDFLYRVFS